MQTERLDYEVGGLAYRRHASGVHEFRFRSVTTSSVDAWFETISAIESHARLYKEHICALYAVQGLWPTPYATQRIIAMSRKTSPQIRASSAVLMDDNAIGIVLVQGILRQIPVRPLQGVQIFFQENDALSWLDERRRCFP
jgi:hypothetical protein